MAKTLQPRNTKYTAAVQAALQALGHATNQQLHERLVQRYPEVSLTTIHRITARMLQRQQLRLAPQADPGSMRFDTNQLQHDHFMCTNCGRLRDTTFDDALRQQIETMVGADCQISGSLTVTGICGLCHQHSSQTGTL